MERLLVDVAAGLGAEESAEEALIEFDLNTWRSAAPDDFVPGPMNDILGAVGLADARTLGVFILGDELRILWDRRMRAEGKQVFVIASRQSAVGIGYEEWILAGVKPGRIVRALARMWFAIDQSDHSVSSWAGFDRYARSRSSLLASVDRACDSVSLVVTGDGVLGLVIEFERGVKLESLARAVDHVVPTEPVWTETAKRNHRVLGAVLIRGTEYEPAAVVGHVSEKPAVVLGLRAEDAIRVYGSLSEPAVE
ncbi:MAG: hypothetical protein ED559_06885 [Phycisphaera sp.]|nr:MAG: hypothetical protein ED559_06885 [Phycisphaera sp.]